MSNLAAVAHGAAVVAQTGSASSAQLCTAYTGRRGHGPTEGEVMKVKNPAGQTHLVNKATGNAASDNAKLKNPCRVGVPGKPILLEVED